ncbi:MAG: M23 family metallopeptidase [Ignavibacteria bacterium]|nr:M23 family metallopeptidase [Ignavibacteria bacterium]MCU7501445.1 M23 family metallopeptidase [Ignavibacteria bacterium]MCU7516039.1 M23 family metallopeptidase [Ignavibacteria bacterium]
MKKLSYLFLLLSLVAGCSTVTRVFKGLSPRDQYEQKIKQAGLLETAMGRAWVEAGARALKDSLVILLPYKEEGYFFSDRAQAASYRFKAKRGEKLVVSVEKDTLARFSIFAELFSIDGGRTERVDFADEGNFIHFEHSIEKDQTFLLRLQPELLKGGYYRLVVTTAPSLHFPVKGKNASAIGSVFGDGRDGGKRRHEGVDIFARRDTPVLSASSGLVIRTGEDRLGGKIVLISNLKDLSFYYAHLDSQLVNVGTYVKEGDVIGLVGNTGNARFTPSHLHFGIYASGHGAIDPYPFIFNLQKAPADPEMSTSAVVGEFVRLQSKKAVLRHSMEKGGKIIMPLERNSVLTVYAASKNSYRVELPDGRTGFVSNAVVEKIEKPILRKNFRKEQEIVDLPEVKALRIASLSKDTDLPLYGEFNEYYLVGYKNGYGWIAK